MLIEAARLERDVPHHVQSVNRLSAPHVMLTHQGLSACGIGDLRVHTSSEQTGIL